MDKANTISRIMAARVLGQKLTGEEEREFEAWLESAPENEALFERVKSLKMTREILVSEQEDYGEKMAARVMEKNHDVKRMRLKRRVYTWGMSAAAVVVLFVIGLMFFNTERSPLAEGNCLSKSDIVPGKVEAVLTFADGRAINITGPLKEEDLKKSLEENQGEEDETAYHSLAVPPGGEFFYELSDGTRVWLNSQTELRFPAAFNGDERRVFLRGEAFFDVTGNREKPFVVSLSQGDITVYGTRFNVTDYEEAPLSTVLVEGSIGFRSGNGQSVRLKPADRLVYESGTGKISVGQVDTMLYTAWVDKMFIFDGQPLQEIMTTLARWYDFNIIFESDDIKSIRLSGRLYRYQDIQVLLNTYEEVAGIKFKIEGKNISISKK